MITDAFASPATVDPGGEDDRTRLSFHLSEPCTVTVEVATAGGDPVDLLVDGLSVGAGYAQVVWDATDSLGAAVSDGAYRLTVNAVDGAGLPAGEVEVGVTVAITTGVGVGLKVGVPVGVTVGVFVAATAGVGVGVNVAVGRGVGVGTSWTSIIVGSL